jgi:hypothetical protein
MATVGNFTYFLFIKFHIPSKINKLLWNSIRVTRKCKLDYGQSLQWCTSPTILDITTTFKAIICVALSWSLAVLLWQNMQQSMQIKVINNSLFLRLILLCERLTQVRAFLRDTFVTSSASFLDLRTSGLGLLTTHTHKYTFVRFLFTIYRNNIYLNSRLKISNVSCMVSLPDNGCIAA